MVSAQTLPEFVREVVDAHGDKLAYIQRIGFRAKRFTFGDVHRMACHAASLIEEAGVAPGDRVLIWAPNSPMWVGAFLGCQLRGAVAVPLMVQNTAEFVVKIAEVTEASVLFGAPGRETASRSVRGIAVDRVIPPPEGPGEFTPGSPLPSDLCQILFTSGTTGTPKGVPQTHANILANLRDILSLGMLRPTDHLMSILPLAHAFEQMADFLAAWAIGVPVTQATSLAGPHVRMNMFEDRPTMLACVPEFLKAAMTQIEAKAREAGREAKLAWLFRHGRKLPVLIRRRLARPVLARFGGRLRAIISAGAALDLEVGGKWEAFGVPVYQAYGATECSPTLSLDTPDGHLMSSVGRPLPSVEVTVADDGELRARGPSVVSGYYKRPDATAESFRDGWYYTDDLGEIDAAGRIHVRGRKSFVIVTPSGEKVYPEDVEAELSKQPGVRDAVVLGLRKGSSFEIHAVLLPQRGVTLETRAAVDGANSKLQPHQRIQGVTVWTDEDFPRTPTHKAKRKDVLAWLESQSSDGPPVDLRVAVGALERAIAEMARVPASTIVPAMRLEGDLRLDSLGRITLLGVLEEDLGVILDETLIGPKTTVAEIRDMIDRHQQKEERYDFRPGPLSTRSVVLRRVLQSCVVFPLLQLYTRTRVAGLENLRGLTTPALFMPNHISPIDGALVLQVLPSPIRLRTAIAGATDVLYEHPAVARYAGLVDLLCNTFPFSRTDQVKSSLQYTGRVLDRGFSVMVFPEGKMATDGRLQEVKAGSGVIAVEMGVPVVPVGIVGADHVVPASAGRPVWPKRGRVTVTFGEPLTFDRSMSYDDAASMIHGALADLAAPGAQAQP